MNSRSPGSRLRGSAVAVIGLVGVGMVWTTLQPHMGEVVGAPLLLVGYCVVGAMFLRGSRSYDGRERLAWRLIGIASLLAAAGILSFGAASAAGHQVPAFGPLDAFFVAAYVFNIAGFWALPHLQGGSMRRARIMIDGLVGAVSIAVVGWVWFFDSYFSRIEPSSTWEVVIGWTYPLADTAMIIVAMVVTLRRSSLRFDPRVLLLGGAFVLQVVADLLYLNRGLGQSFQEADPAYPLLLGTLACLLAVSLLLGRPLPAREYAERRTPWWAMIAPYGAAVGMIVMLVARLADQQQDMETIELLAGAIVVVLLIIFRQALAIRETRELVDRQRSALVSSISHELRTPLTAMVGFLDVLSDPGQDMSEESRRELMGVVTQQASYMARIVSDLVMLNRAEPDLSLRERTVELDGVAESAVASLDLDSGAGVVIDVEPGLRAYIDPDRVHQALVNLLINAARYGGPSRLVVAREQGSDLVLEVHDDGPGVPKRYELMIWDRFERGAHRYNAGTPGSGIGLALVVMLARAHGGGVGYRRSERLGGACFTMVLPGRVRRPDWEVSLEHAGRLNP